MNLKAQLDLCRQYMLDFHAHDYSGHDIAHVERSLKQSNVNV